MHKHDIIHRDIKLQNIVLCHVIVLLLREWQKYAILDGQCIALENLGQQSVEHRFIYLLKY